MLNFPQNGRTEDLQRIIPLQIGGKSSLQPTIEGNRLRVCIGRYPWGLGASYLGKLLK